MTPTDEARYAGSGAAVVRRGRTTVVLSDGPAGAARAVWDGLGADSPVTAVLDALAGLPGTSLTTLPPFAAVTVSDDGAAHVLVRGRFRAVLATTSGDEVVDGADVATWHERRVASAVSVVLGTKPRGVAAVLADADAWPLVEGVVRGDEVALVLVPDAVGAPTDPFSAMPLPAPANAVLPAPANAVLPAPVDGVSGAPGDDVPPAPTDDLPSAPVPGPAPEPAGGGFGPVLAVPEVETLLPAAAPGRRFVTEPQPQAEGEPEPEAEPPSLPVGPEPAAVRPPRPPAPPSDRATVAPDATQAGPIDVADDGYAHLWGETVMRTVEDAAVRPDSEDDEADHGASSPAAPTTPEAPSAAPVPAPPAPPAAPLVTSEPGGLIAGIPRTWSTGLAAATASSSAPVEPTPPAQPLADRPAPAPSSSGDDTDHDGHTIMSSELAQLRSGAAPAQDAPAPALPVGAGPQVLALLCVHGHANPPSRVDCRTCGAPLEGEAELAVRPVLGRVQVAGGPRIDLDRPVVVGRRPRSPRSTAGEMPRLVTVASPNQDVSRSHVEVRLEGWHVLVTDLATTNGTVLHRGGQSPQRLHPGEATLIVDGDVVDLGDGATLTFEEIW